MVALFPATVVPLREYYKGWFSWVTIKGLGRCVMALN